jgi:hypothetical protein
MCSGYLQVMRTSKYSHTAVSTVKVALLDAGTKSTAALWKQRQKLETHTNGSLINNCLDASTPEFDVSTFFILKVFESVHSKASEPRAPTSRKSPSEAIMQSNSADET